MVTTVSVIMLSSVWLCISRKYKNQGTNTYDKPSTTVLLFGSRGDKCVDIYINKVLLIA